MNVVKAIRHIIRNFQNLFIQNQNLQQIIRQAVQAGRQEDAAEQEAGGRARRRAEDEEGQGQRQAGAGACRGRAQVSCLWRYR